MEYEDAACGRKYLWSRRFVYIHIITMAFRCIHMKYKLYDSLDDLFSYAMLVVLLWLKETKNESVLAQDCVAISCQLFQCVI